MHSESKIQLAERLQRKTLPHKTINHLVKLERLRPCMYAQMGP